MKPIQLKLAGLNSFVEEQTIDFETLTERGLFGIFGPTGSGKSSILDAMTLCLYNKIPRETVEFINTDTGKTMVSFTFSIKTAEGEKRYTVERTYRIQKSGIQKRTAKLYETETEHVLADKLTEVNEAVEDIIGMQYNDFICSVVLPQGKFSKFLTLQGTERGKMLENIFHLEKYGQQLEEKLKEKRDTVKEQLQAKRGQLGVYEAISPESIQQKELQLQQQQREQRELEEIVTKQQQVVAEQEKLFGEIQQVKALERRKQGLQEREGKYTAAKIALQTTEQAEKVMPYVKQFEKTEQMWQNCQRDREQAVTEREKSHRQTAVYGERYPQFSQETDVKLALVRKEQGLQQAMEWAREGKQWQQEIQTWEELLQNISSNMAVGQKKQQEQTKQREEIQEKIKYHKEKAASYKVQPAYKEAIRQGAELEKLQEQQRAEEGILSQKRKEKERILTTWIATWEQLQIQEKTLLSQQKALEEKQQTLPPEEDAAVLLEEQKAILEAKSLLEQLQTWEKTVEIQQGIQETVERDITEQEKKCQQIARALLVIQQEEEQAKKQLDAWEKQNMAATLAKLLENGIPCPVCGSKEHPQKAEALGEHIGQALAKQAEEIQIQRKKQETIEKQEQQKWVVLQNKRETTQQTIQELLTQIDGRTVEDVKQKVWALEKKLQQKQKVQRERKQIEEHCQQEMAKLQEAQKQILQEITEIHTTIKHTRKEVETLQEEQETLQEQQQKTEQAWQQEKEKMPLDCSFQEAQQRLLQEEEEKLYLEEQIELLSQKKENIDKGMAQLQQEQQELEKEENRYKVQKEEKQSALEKRNRDIEMVTEGNPLEEYLADVRAYQKEMTALEQAERKAEEAQKQLQIQQRVFQEQKQEVKQQLGAHGFVSMEEVKGALLTEEQKKNLWKNIEQYERMWQETEVKLQDLQKTIGDRTVTAEALQQQQQQAEQWKEKKELLLQKNAVLSSLVAEQKAKLQTIGILQKELEALEKQASTIEELSKVLRGRGFMKYIAGNQLQYITEEASRRLGQMTNDRYGLTAEGVTFKIRDNACGGILREPSTLSGGEVFLTSLSLALALSSKIQMKNAAPLEFFFLDEGFGTLDKNLIDVVMSSLERLQQEQLHVGLISHVEELKERIPMRLLVTPANPTVHGSRTTLESL